MIKRKRSNFDLFMALIAFILILFGYHKAHGQELKRPVLTKAIGVIESGLNPFARGKHHERGAYQVIERHWGKVPRQLHEQGLQHERILEELLKASGGNVENAVRRYNGRGQKAARYARRVRREAIQIALLGVI